MGIFDKIKGMAEDAGGAISKGAKNVTDSSKKMVEKTKLKNKISKLEEDIEKKYTEIGKQYFKVNSQNPAEEYADMVNFIIESQNKINEIQAEIIAMDNKYICPTCGAGIPENAKFCSSCGAKFEKPVSDNSAETSSKCPKCGADIESDAKFCTACGAKFEENNTISSDDIEIIG